MLKTVTGKVELYNEFGEQLFSGLEGTIIELNDTPYTRTNTNGEYELKNVHPGSYQIKIKKEGFGDIVDTINTADTKRNFALLHRPTTRISEVSVTDIQTSLLGNISFVVNYKIENGDDDLYRRNIKLVIGKGNLTPDCTTCWTFLIRPENPNAWNSYKLDVFSSTNMKAMGIGKGDAFSIRVIPYTTIQYKTESNRTKQITVFGQPSNQVQAVY